MEGHDFRRQKPLLVATYLCLQGPTSKRRLAELFWHDAADARDSLSTTLRRLNGLADEPLLAAGDPVEGLLQCDANDFLKAVASGEHGAALELYRGRFLEAVDLPVSEEVEEWIFASRERFADLARWAHISMARSARSVGDLVLASQHAESALDVERALPWDEDQIAVLLEQLQSAGSPRASEAKAMARELGVAFSLPDLAGISGTGRNIPRPGTSFVGREFELEKLESLLQAGVARLITLHGPGGVGKSRLALETAARAAESPQAEGAVYFVQLEPFADAEMLPTAVATAMNLVLPGGDRTAHIVRVIGARSLLLVLDNFERLLEGSSFLAQLLRSCPNVDIIVTSRVALGLAEEHVMTVGGLHVDGPVGESEALQLLFARMRQHNTLARITPDDELAAQDICLFVDGSPLAIELAAAQTRYLPLHELLAELGSGMEILYSRDPTALERQRSMRASLDISWRLLADTDRQALAEVSVFRGGFTRYDSQAITGIEPAVLERLADASLLRVLPNGRFERHPIIREYSVARLAERPERELELKQRHAERYLGLLASRDYQILNGEALDLALWIEEELANLEIAIERSLSSGRLELVAAVAVALAHYAELRGRFGEVVKLLEAASRAAESEGEGTHVAVLGGILGALPFTYFRLGRYQEAIETGQRALALTAEADPVTSDWPRWAARQGMALSSIILGDFEFARSLLATNEAGRPPVAPDASPDDRIRRIVDVTVGTSLETAAFLDLHLGNFDAALESLRRAEGLFAPLGAPSLGYVYWSLGQTYLALGEPGQARTTVERGLAVAHETGFRNQVGHLLAELVLIHLGAGDAGRAEPLALQALEAATNSGDKWLEATVRARWALVALRQGAHNSARERLTTSLQVARAAGAYGFAHEGILGLTELLVAAGKLAEAVRLLSYVRHSPLSPAAVAAQAEVRLNAGDWSLDPGSYSAAVAAGAELTPADAFAFALTVLAE